MTRSNPEAKLQINVKTYLTWCLPDSIEWTASAAGVTLGSNKIARMRQGGKSKAMGVRKGWPDLQFLFPDGVTRYIELKAGSGLSVEQRAFRDRCYAVRPARDDLWALCRSVDEVEATLRRWGAEMKNHPFNVATPDDEARPMTWADADGEAA